jgi:hypothetical protein
MARSVQIRRAQARRTTEELIELARKYAPKHSQDLSVILGEVLGDMDDLQKQLHSPPADDDAAQIVIDLEVDLETLARKCRNLADLLRSPFFSSFAGADFSRWNWRNPCA